MQLIIKCNNCNEILTIAYTNITSLGNIEVRTAPCGCAVDNCSDCEEVEAAKELRKELAALKETSKKKKIELGCSGHFKSILSCYECPDRADCLKKLGEDYEKP